MFNPKIKTNAVEDMAVRELDLLTRRNAAGERLRGAERAAGEQLLDDPERDLARDLADTTAEIVHAQSEISAIDGALRACRERRQQAIRQKRELEASALWKKAEELRAELGSIADKMKVHLEAITFIEESVFSVVAHGVTRTQRLNAEIVRLEECARALEGELPRSGTVDLDGITDTRPLVDAVLRYEAEGPDVPSVLAWAASCEKGRHFGNHPRRIYLVWKDGGVIDVQASYIQVSALVTHIGGGGSNCSTYSQQPMVVSGSDIFRAPGEASHGFGVV